MWLTLDDVADLKKGKHCQKNDGNIPIIGSGKNPLATRIRQIQVMTPLLLAPGARSVKFTDGANQSGRQKRVWL